MSKQFTIGKGNNLGKNKYYQRDENLNSFYYRGTLQDVFFDTNVIWEALRTTNYYSILKQNKEFEEWQKTEEADKCTKREYLQKILSIMPKEIIEQVEQYIEHKKAQNKPMLELIESLYKKSSEKSYVKPIEFADGYAIL